MTTTEIERLVVSLIGDGSSYQKMLEEAKKITGQTMSEIGSMSQSVTSFTSNLNNVGNAIGGIVDSLKSFTAITDDFARFDKAMTYSQSIMSLTTDQMERMESQALSLARNGSHSAEDFAKAYFYLASAGLNVEQQLGSMPIISKFATAGAFDLARATSLAADAQSALGLKSQNTAIHVQNLTRVTDVLVRANVLANANVEQFSVALTSKAGASLKSVNKDIEEGVAVLAAMADQGIKAELAGNTLSRFLILLQKSAIDNAEAYKILGFSVYDNQGKMKNLADIIENLETSLSGMSNEAKAAALDMLGFEARIQGAILPLLGTSQAIRNYEMELRRAGGYTESVSDKIKQSLSAQLGQLSNQFNVLSIELGKSFVPIVEEVTKSFKALMKDFDNNPIVKSATLEFIKYSTILLGLVGIISAVKVAIVSLYAVMAANPIGATTLVVGSLAAAFYSVSQATTKTTEAMKKDQEVWTGYFENIKKLGDKDRENLKIEIDLELGKNEQAATDKIRDKLQKSTAEYLSKMTELDRMRDDKTTDPTSLKIFEAEVADLKKTTELLGSELDKVNEKLKGPTIQKVTLDIMQFEKQLREEINALGVSTEEVKKNQIAKDLLSSKQDLNKLSNIKSLLAQKKSKEETIRGNKALDDYNKSLEDQIATFGMTSREAEIYRLNIANVSQEKVKAAEQNKRYLEHMEKEKELMDKGKSIFKDVMTPQEKYTETLTELNGLVDDGFISFETYSRAVEKAGKELIKTKQATQDLTATSVNSVAGMAKIMEYNDSLKSEKSSFKYKIEDSKFKQPKDGFILDKPNPFFDPKLSKPITNNIPGKPPQTTQQEQTKDATQLLIEMVKQLQQISNNTSEGPTLGLPKT